MSRLRSILALTVVLLTSLAVFVVRGEDAPSTPFNIEASAAAVRSAAGRIDGQPGQFDHCWCHRQLRACEHDLWLHEGRSGLSRQAGRNQGRANDLPGMRLTFTVMTGDFDRIHIRLGATNPVRPARYGLKFDFARFTGRQRQLSLGWPEFVVIVWIEPGQGEQLRRIPGALNRFNMDMIPAGPMVIVQNRDMPGVIGKVGSTFGDANINIADMVISRDFQADGTAQALMVLKTDSLAPDALLQSLRSSTNILRVKSMSLPEK